MKTIASRKGAPRILYAISGHGYGHATRSLAIAAEIRRLLPSVEIVFSTTVGEEFLARQGAFGSGRSETEPGDPVSDRARPRLEYRRQAYEPGTAESHCFQVDPGGTRSLYRSFSAEREGRIRQESEFLRAEGISGVVSDIAAIPIAAAARAGIPSVAVSNFTWDWILAPILAGDGQLAGLPSRIAADYSSAEAYVRLKFHPEAHPFRDVIDVPLIGRRAVIDPEDCRRLLGFPPRSSRPLILVAIGGLKAGAWPDLIVDPTLDLDFLVVGDLPIRFLPGRARFLPERLPDGIGFADLVAACDAALAKPGYGMCSECAVNGTPMVSIERRGFVEYGALKAGIGDYVPFRELSLDDFFAGRWGPSLSAVLGSPRRPATEEDGAGEAARRILGLLGLGKKQVDI